jgi:TusA-related sulfurtransferase
MMKEITLETKIADLLNEYEGMKEILIKINPKFKKLNNPVLRRTLAKIAGVKQAAVVGGMDPVDLLNQLREAVGQAPVDDINTPLKEVETQKAPDWILQEPKRTLNANQILDEERNPLAELHKALKAIHDGEMITIEADFQPEPLIDEMLKAGHEVFSKKVASDHFITYIKK